MGTTSSSEEPTLRTVRNAIFAANRARGHIALDVDATGGRSHRSRVHEEGSLRVRFPHRAADALEAVIVNTAGGMTGGDRFSITLSVAPGAKLTACTAAAEKIYRSTGDDAEVKISLAVGDDARLAWLPQETILFNASIYENILYGRLDADKASVIEAAKAANAHDFSEADLEVLAATPASEIREEMIDLQDIASVDDSDAPVGTGTEDIMIAEDVADSSIDQIGIV